MGPDPTIPTPLINTKYVLNKQAHVNDDVGILTGSYSPPSPVFGHLPGLLHVSMSFWGHGRGSRKGSMKFYSQVHTLGRAIRQPWGAPADSGIQAPSQPQTMAACIRRLAPRPVPIPSTSPVAFMESDNMSPAHHTCDMLIAFLS